MNKEEKLLNDIDIFLSKMSVSERNSFFKKMGFVVEDENTDDYTEKASTIKCTFHKKRFGSHSKGIEVQVTEKNGLNRNRSNTSRCPSKVASSRTQKVVRFARTHGNNKTMMKNSK